MQKESFFKRFVRNVVFADYKSTDLVPVIGGTQNNLFALSSKVSEIQQMSRIAKTFLYLWMLFVLFLTSFFIFIGFAVVREPQTFAKLGVLGTIFLVFLELFILIQGLSVLGYFRWRIKQRMSQR